MNITINRLYIYIINSSIIIFSALIGIYILLNENVAQGYELLYLLPFIFGLCFVLFLSKPLVVSKSIFLWTFMVFAALRYLALPFLMAFESYYTGYAIYPPHSSSINKGILLMIYEILISSILIRIIYKKNLYSTIRPIREFTRKHETIIKNKLIYIAFIGFAIFIMVLNPRVLQGISFFNNFNRNSSAQVSNITLISRQSLMLAKMLLYFLIVKKLHFKYAISQKSRYIWLTYLISFLNIGIFIGVNRKRILMNAVATVLTINLLYPKQKRKTTIIMFILAFGIFIQLTMFRFHGNSDKGLFGDSAGTLQVYLSGPYNMAIAVETRDEYRDDISGFNVIYDIARPFYGIGSYFKKYDTYLSTEYFNKRLSIGSSHQRSDQIMPITGQGLLHFGYILSPIYLLLSIIMGFYVEKKSNRTENFEKRYVLILISTMLGQSMGVNLTIITNFITFEGILFYLIYWVNSKISIRTIES